MSAPDPLTFLERLQADVGARLESVNYFADVPVLVARKGVIESDVAQALTTLNERSGKTGAVVIVLMPTCEVPESETPGPQLVAAVTVRCVENPVFNLDLVNGGTGKSAESLGLAVLRALHHYAFDDGHVLYANRRAMEPNNSFEGQVAYDAQVATRFGLDPAPGCAAPRVSLNANATAVQMLCTTPAATIFYTDDGSFPWPGNPAARPYDGAPPADEIPLPATPALIRAAAYVDGREGSDVTELFLEA